MLDLPNPMPLWEGDAGFQAIMERVRGRTLVQEPGCYVLYQLACSARELPGDAAELGVYHGGTARLLAESLGGKTLHLFDTFGGLPEVDPRWDCHRKGEFGDTSLAEVQDYLADCVGVRFHRGLFPATASVVADIRFSLVHVDADLYRSVRDAFEFFAPRLVRGGFMIFDDYGQRYCPGARQALDEIGTPAGFVRWYLPTGQLVYMRRVDRV